MREGKYVIYNQTDPLISLIRQRIFYLTEKKMGGGLKATVSFL